MYQPFEELLPYITCTHVCMQSGVMVIRRSRKAYDNLHHMHTYIHVYIHSGVTAIRRHTCIHVYIHSGVTAIRRHTYIHVYIHSGVTAIRRHTYIHVYIHSGVTAIRRLRKTDNNRVARACGGTIVHRPSELKESDVGTNCGLFLV
jgi:hypothetical protein